MKTYYHLCILFAVALIGCSKSDNPEIEDIDNPSFAVGYTILLEHEGMLKSTLLNANFESVSINPYVSLFENINTPLLVYRDGHQISHYNSNSNCIGSISRYDFNNAETVSSEVFGDLDNCDLVIIAIAHTESTFFIAYEIPSSTKDKYYFVRMVDINNSDTSANYVDVEISKKPQQLVFSEDRLFILVHDKDVTEEYALVIVDHDSKTLIHEKKLGLDVQKLEKNKSGDILVSYPTRHIVLHRNTLSSVSEVRYLDGKEPKFGYAKDVFFEGNKIYYQLQTPLSPDYSHIPAVFDFGTNTTTLYIYENIFTTEKLKFEYEIGDTSMVSYDPKNNLILIGYTKKNQSNLGGLLRIKPAPDPKFIDNTNLNGIPKALFLK